MDSYIPKEKLTAYERWELAAFDEDAAEKAAAAKPEPAPEPVAEARPPLPTAEEVERIHNEARSAGERDGYAAGYESGRAEGLAAGRAEGMALAQREAERLRALAEEFRRALDPVEDRFAEQLLHLAIDIARQVIRGSLDVRPELLLPAVREAMATLPNPHGHPTLILHPASGELVRRHLGEQLAHSGWRLLEDAALGPGDCRVENLGSEVDATLATRWRRVIETIGASAGDWLEPPQ